MFEDYSTIDIVITFFLLYILIRILRLIHDPEIQTIREKIASLEKVECMVEEINGQFYLWMNIPDEGCQFVGQGTDKEHLAKIGQTFLKRKYGIVDN